MAVAATRGYGRVQQQGGRGGWTVSAGFGGYIFTGLRIYRSSFMPETLFTTIGDSTTVVTDELISAVVSAQSPAVIGSRENVVSIASRRGGPQVSSRESDTEYSSREGPYDVSATRDAATVGSEENPTVGETTDPAERREED